MKPSKLLAIACTAMVAACQQAQDVNAPIFRNGSSPRSDASVTSSSARLTVEEQQLVTELVAMYPPGEADVVSRAFADPFMTGAKSTNPRAQAIINRIDAIRHIRSDSLKKAVDALSSKHPAVVAATIVLVQQLPDSTAAVVVWRRSHLVPHDVIELRADHATIGALGAAVRLLTKLRRTEGDSAVADEHFVLRQDFVPPHWRGSMNAFVNSDLEKLRQSEATSLPPFGRVHSRTIWLAATKAKP